MVPDTVLSVHVSELAVSTCRRLQRNWIVTIMATPMLRARQALRIIDKFERATAESRRATQDLTAGPQVEDLDSNAQGFNNSLPEQAVTGNVGPDQDSSNPRSLQRPPSHTTVDIPELATRDSARVRLGGKSMIHALLLDKLQLVASLQDPQLQCALLQSSSNFLSPCCGIP